MTERKTGCKACIGCGRPFERPIKRSTQQWDSTNYCSSACANTRRDLDNSKIASMYISGMSTRDIAKIFGTNHMTIRKRLIDYGVPIRGNRGKGLVIRESPISTRVCPECKKSFTVEANSSTTDYCSISCISASRQRIIDKEEALRAKMVSMYRRGIGTVRIGGLLGISKYVVRAALLKAGIQLRDHTFQMSSIRPALVCLQCGAKYRPDKPFEGTIRKFCSQECARINNLANKKETSIEKVVREWLTEFSIAFKPQAPIGQYISDFIVESKRLVIECDGTYWHSLPDAIARDKAKDELLEKLGYTILRLPEEYIKKNPTDCKKLIHDTLFSSSNKTYK